MAAFDLDVDAGRLDFRLMANGAVTLFWRPHVFTEAIDWMSRQGYRVVSLDANGWISDDDLHRDIAAVLDFPDYYGRNLVQSSNPNITFEPVAATPILWNYAEWPDAKRQPGSAPYRLLPE